MKNVKTTVMCINDRHPAVDKAMNTLNATGTTLRGGYYDDKLAEVLAMQEYKVVNGFTLHCAGQLIEMFHNDNGQ